ncbi:AraC family transcriptional regulator [Pseudomonas capeferrum]|uniref:AraC family transcriptional regulator n=1 Tax=Pseudomonas capeferrum TaxID=1495066 RepID=UPI0015E35183|nr:AraC family transcriptional regulator [Pseudomonas capeferrum]MBA1203320.1 AraC family transcriptional regulator [Pseudomonas capeferrum]
MPTLCDDIDRLATLHFIALVDAYTSGLGHGTASLLAGTEVLPQDLEDPDKLITPAEELMILRNALRLTGARHLGLELGSRCRLAAYGIFGFTLLSSSDLRAALALFFDYPLPLGTGFSLGLEQEQGVASLTVSANFAMEDKLHRLAIEFCLTALQSVIADLLYRPLPVLGVNFNAIDQPVARSYEAHFSCPVRFDPSKPNSLSFDARWLDYPLPCAHAVSHREMKARCSTLQSRLESPRDFLANVRSAICARFDTSPSLTNIAASMACSSKTLQRHLRAAGTSFHELLGEARYQRAQELLLRQVPITRVAQDLGFSEPAAFRRAFQRWSGCTPSQYRSQVRH